VPGRGTIVARLKGNGSKRPLLLLGHLDTVGIERDKWTVDPFVSTAAAGSSRRSRVSSRLRA
jgi:acetylornithine deacetylase/succinyl-diaminopimelate desuccinylase-like protein